jgi:hypothetical protein
VNIKLYVAARDAIADLGQSAKGAVLDIISHAPQGEEVAAVAVETVAADIGVHVVTARRALRLATRAGYLAVERPGTSHDPTVWKVLPARFVPAQIAPPFPRDLFPASRANGTKFTRATRAVGLKEGLKEGGAAARARHPASGAAVDNGNGTHHPDSCGCGGTGWLAGADRNAVTRCPEVVT